MHVGGFMAEGPIRYVSTEEIIDIFSELQSLARIEPEVRLDHTGDYILPVEELEALTEGAHGKPLLEAASYYLQTLLLMRLFPDGNFRLALLAVEFFLESNGARIDYTLSEAEDFREKLLALEQEHYPGGDAPAEELIESLGGPVQDVCTRFVKKHAQPTS